MTIIICHEFKKGVIIMTLNNTLTSHKYDSWISCYNYVKEFAEKKGFKNTLLALDLAKKLHKDQKRKSGEPYIIHPLQVAIYLITMRTNDDTVIDDITIAAALLHDSIEDCHLSENGIELVTKYKLNPDVLYIVLLLTKDPNIPKKDFDEKLYYRNLQSSPKALIIKLSDRVNNCSTMVNGFSKEKMIKYVNETIEFFYPLCKYAKSRYPELSHYVTIIKYQLVSICETIAGLYDVPGIINIDENGYLPTFLFIKGYAIGREMDNTLKALSIIRILYKNKKRRCGDPYIIHPLRVCSYLISLKFNSDLACAAALLHEIYKSENDEKLVKELVESFNINPIVLDIARIVCKEDDMSLSDYYERLQKNTIAVLIKFSNRANTCTNLHEREKKEQEAYLKEYDEYLIPLFAYMKKTFPHYSNMLDNMDYHITTTCQIIESNLS